VKFSCGGKTGIKSVESADFIPEISPCTLLVYPNPFEDVVKFNIVMERDSHVRLEIYNQSGMLLKVILDEDLLKGDDRTAAFDASKYPHSVFIYRLVTNANTMSGTVMKVK
jgi:hypothetical protein